ncbi:MAG TPA: 23S rRNA (adenine(2503)-C(2))-methyltransferase RlmN, partial [Sumerlaeia bacterium]|nr:23S rRNA (adenine(2503)-C(2))-methyltransferase RlmN [Sumerlaeia bacterium]
MERAARPHAGHPAYRARQILQWVYQKGAQDFEGMTNLPKEL